MPQDLPNCIWHVPLEWYGLKCNSVLLTKIYWDYVTHIVRFCVSSEFPINPDIPLTKESNLQVKFVSKAMASLHDLLCYSSLTYSDPLLEELHFYLPTSFHSHIFDYIVYEHSSDDESVHSINSSVSAFYSDDSSYFFWTFVFTFRKIFFSCNSTIFTTKTRTRQKKAAER